MPSVEERLAYLEGRVGDQAAALADIRTDIREVRSEVDGLRGDMNQGFASLRGEMDRHFAGIDARFVAADAKITWLIGIQVGMLLMIASAALGYLFN